MFRNLIVVNALYGLTQYIETPYNFYEQNSFGMSRILNIKSILNLY